MIVRKLRLQRGWSQDQLAQLAGLNIRTVQRIERGQKASLESLNALAAVFEVDVKDLTPETPTEATMANNESGEPADNATGNLSQEEQATIEYVRDLKGFYQHLFSYAITIAFLFVLNLIVSPDYLWVKWAALGWGIGVLSHGFSVYESVNFLGPDWEKKQIEKRLGKKL